MTDLHVDVPGCRLAVKDEGSGPPIVLLHAGVADLRSWDDVVPPLLAAGHRVVRYDARGFGQSDTEDVEFSQPGDLVAVLDALGIERAALVGNSRGGAAAFDSAIVYPDRVVAAIGVGAGLSGFDGGATPEEQVVFEAYDAVDKADPFDVDALTDFEVRVWMDGPNQPADRVPSATREALRQMDLPLNEVGHVRGQERRLDPPANDRLTDLRCPVLAIAGELDFSEVALAARHLAADAPNATAIIWPDVAHMIGMEQPDRLAAAIAEFLAPLEPWS